MRTLPVNSARRALKGVFSSCLCVVLTFSVQARETTQLPPIVARALEDNAISAKDLSVFVQDVTTNEIMMAHNSDVARQPASTIKVLTSIVALDTLGPAFTWTTRAYTTAPVKQGVLDGDLIIVGGGDPYMVAERWWSFVTQLRQTGLTAINGDIVIDRTFFAPMSEDRSAFDSQPERSYNVVPDALMVNFQTATFSIGSGYLEPGAAAKRASISVDPLPANLDLNNNVRLGSGGCRRAQQGLRFDTPQGASGNELVIRGMVPRNCGRYSTSRAIMSAPEFAYGTFRTLWEQMGGSIKGKLRLEPLPPKARLLYEFNSLTLGEVVRLVNKFSNNVMARHLFLTLAAEQFGPPATTDNGRRAIQSWLTDKHIDIPGLTLDNGSGLSREERITARGLGQVLHAGWHSQYMPEFIASLPLAGADGTLRNRFNAPAMRGRIRMKTGHLDDVSSLAGYVNAVSGNNYIVVIVVNHPGAIFGSGDDVESAVLRWVFGQ